jgi:dTDP-glucose 4,6-dehydratase
LKIAILGGGNPYAINLASMLLQDHEVIGIGRSALKGEAFTLGVERLGYQYHVYSIGPDTDFIIDLLKAEKPEVIVNYAAQGEGQASFKVENWKYFYRTNVQALVELTERLHGAPWLKRFIQIGTSELYGSVESPSDESSPLRPSSPYAVSKMAFDLHLMSVSKVCGFPALIVRPSNAYCPGQQLHRIIPKAFIYGLSGRRIPLHGGGLARKSYLHADDLSRAVVLLAKEGLLGEVYNVGPKDPITIRKLLEFCAATLQMGFTELVEEAPERTGQDGCYHLNSDKIRALGWTDSIPLGLGLRGMLDWIEKYPELIPMPTSYKLRA